MRKKLPLHRSASAAWHSASCAGSGLRALLRAVDLILVRHEVDARELVNRVGQFVRTAPVSGFSAS
jgi:hypothetical protein